MSLLDLNFEDFVLVERTKIPDGESGFSFALSDGMVFKAHARLDSSAETDRARAEHLNDIYTITTGKAVCLTAKNIIRRVSDNKLFRVVSDGTDCKTPDGAGLDMRQVRAERLSACQRRNL